MTFTETLAPLVFTKDLPWGNTPAERESRDIILHQWSHLRPALLYFLRYRPGQHTDEAMRDVVIHLMEYGASVQKVREPAASCSAGLFAPLRSLRR